MIGSKTAGEQAKRMGISLKESEGKSSKNCKRWLVKRLAYSPGSTGSALSASRVGPSSNDLNVFGGNINSIKVLMASKFCKCFLFTVLSEPVFHMPALAEDAGDEQAELSLFASPGRASAQPVFPVGPVVARLDGLSDLPGSFRSFQSACLRSEHSSFPNGNSQILLIACLMHSSR